MRQAMRLLLVGTAIVGDAPRRAPGPGDLRAREHDRPRGDAMGHVTGGAVRVWKREQVPQWRRFGLRPRADCQAAQPVNVQR